MAERNNPFKVTVVADGEGFLVGHYPKVDPERVPDLPGVIRRIAHYSSDVLVSEPTYVALSKFDQLIIDSVRSALLERDRVMAALLESACPMAVVNRSPLLSEEAELLLQQVETRPGSTAAVHRQRMSKIP